MTRESKIMGVRRKITNQRLKIATELPILLMQNQNAVVVMNKLTSNGK